MNRILKSYFYWTYPRGNFHYDVMVSLILLFIFLTPHVWDFGDKPSLAAGPPHPIQVSGDGDHGLVVTVPASDVSVPAGATDNEVRHVLRAAIEPVTGDAVAVVSWKTAQDDEGRPVWKIWAHR